MHCVFFFLASRNKISNSLNCESYFANSRSNLMSTPEESNMYYKNVVYFLYFYTLYCSVFWLFYDLIRSLNYQTYLFIAYVKCNSNFRSKCKTCFLLMFTYIVSLWHIGYCRRTESISEVASKLYLFLSPSDLSGYFHNKKNITLALQNFLKCLFSVCF